MRFTATTTRGAEDVLAAELSALGAQKATPGYGIVTFDGPLEVGYRACLWSRIASRVLLVLDHFHCPHADALYDGVSLIAWEDHLEPRRTLAVDFVGGSEALRHSVFAAQKTKDAVVDRLLDRRGSRPSVDLHFPDLRINVHLHNEIATVSLDLSGEALHLRGGRAVQEAPLKETLAAAMLWMVGWPTLAASGASLVDPFCGSATLAIEAASIARNIAPGLRRRRFGFQGWSGHDARLWDRLEREARAAQTPTTCAIWASDVDANAIALAQQNIASAHLSQTITLRCQPMKAMEPPDARTGLLITNPPYGMRIGDTAALEETYARLGDTLRYRFLGWRAAVLTGSPRLAKRLGLKPSRRHILHNGPIECRLIELEIAQTPPRGRPDWRG